MGLERNEKGQAKCLSDYVDVPVLTYDSIRKKVLELYVERVHVPRTSLLMKDEGKRIAFRYMVKAEKVFQYVVANLGKVARLPPIDSLNPFYAELLNIATNGSYEVLRKQAALAVKVIAGLWKEYRERILNAGENAKKYSVEFVGRALSILKRKVKNLEATKNIAYVSHNTPCIDFEKPLIIVSGMPQVGKSTFVSRVSSAKPKTAPYPFTTKNIVLGHINLGNDAFIQVMDTPGILDRPINEMNEIERKAIAAIKYLKAVVLYLMDPSRDSYYSFDSQLAVLKTVETLVGGKEKIIVVFNKADKVDEERLRECTQIVNKLGYEKALTMSALYGTNVWNIIWEAIKLYDAIYGTNFEGVLKVYSSSITSASISSSSSSPFSTFS